MHAYPCKTHVWGIHERNGVILHVLYNINHVVQHFSDFIFFSSAIFPFSVKSIQLSQKCTPKFPQKMKKKFFSKIIKLFYFSIFFQNNNTERILTPLRIDVQHTRICSPFANNLHTRTRVHDWKNKQKQAKNTIFSRHFWTPKIVKKMGFSPKKVGSKLKNHKIPAREGPKFTKLHFLNISRQTGTIRGNDRKNAGFH